MLKNLMYAIKAKVIKEEKKKKKEEIKKLDEAIDSFLMKRTLKFYRLFDVLIILAFIFHLMSF